MDATGADWGISGVMGPGASPVESRVSYLDSITIEAMIETQALSKRKAECRWCWSAERFSVQKPVGSSKLHFGPSAASVQVRNYKVSVQNHNWDY